MKFRIPVLLVIVLSTLAGCTALPAPKPEPSYEDKLFTKVACKAHIVEPWRTTSASIGEGRVLIAGDQPPNGFPGAFVALQRDGEDYVWTTYTDSDGRFTFAGLLPGVYQFVACASGMDPDMGWVILKAGEPSALEFFLRYGV